MKEQPDDLKVGERVRVRTWSGFASGKVEKVGRRDGKVVVRLDSGATTRIDPSRITRVGEDVSCPTLGTTTSAPRVAEPYMGDDRLDSMVVAARTFLPQPKKRTVRDRDYLDWLRGRPCVACGFDGECDPSHHGRGGVGLKASDEGAVSLCRACHDHWHQHGELRTKRGWKKDKTDRWLAAHAARLRAEFKLSRRET